MFSTAISKIWLVGLVLFAAAPFLISRSSNATDAFPGNEKIIERPVQNVEDEVTGEERDPATAQVVEEQTALAK